MNEDSSNERFEKEIRPVISLEEEGALRDFRKGDFETRVERLVRARSLRRRPFRFARWMPAAAMLALVALMGTAAILVFLGRGRPKQASAPVSFERALMLLPALQDSGPGAGPAGGAPRRLSPMAEDIARALGALSKAPPPETDKGALLPSGPEGAPRPGFKRSMELFLENFEKRLKEV